MKPSRKTRVSSLALAVGLAVGGALAPTAAFADEPSSLDLATASVGDLSRALEQGRTTSVAVTAAYLDRIERIDRSGATLRSVIAVRADALRAAEESDARRRSGEPRGPLEGIPVLVKDNIDVAGMPTTAGSAALRDSVPAGDSTLVAELESHGAVVLGKANLSEFAGYMSWWMPPGYSAVGGQSVNPYDPAFPVLGSSAGSAVAAAAGLAAVTIGTETSGSILSPSQANSVVGLKPTVGSVSRTGVFPLSASQDTAGPMGRSVADVALTFGAMDAKDEADGATSANPNSELDYTSVLDPDALAGARIGYLASDDPTYIASLHALTAAGAELVPTTFTGSDNYASEFPYEFKTGVDDYLAALPAGAPMRSLADIIAYNDAHPDTALVHGDQELLREAQAVDDENASVIAAHESTVAAIRESSSAAINETLASSTLDAIAWTSSGGWEWITMLSEAARAGYPSISVPSGYAAGGEPRSLVLTGTAWSEPELIGYAYAFESATDAWRSPQEANPALARTSLDLTDSVDEQPTPTPAATTTPSPAAPVPSPTRSIGAGLRAALASPAPIARSAMPLAATGADTWGLVAPWAAAGTALLALGAVTAVLARRRRADRTAR